MASAVRAIQKTQNLGLAVTGGVLAFYYFSPDLSNVKFVKVPKDSLFDASESPTGSNGEGAVKDCYMLSVPLHNLRVRSKSSEGTSSDGPPIAKHLDTTVEDLAQALVQCQAFKFEERVLQTLGLEEKFDINFPAGDFKVDSKVGPFVVTKRSPGEILLHNHFEDQHMDGNTWLAVRLPRPAHPLVRPPPPSSVSPPSSSLPLLFGKRPAEAPVQPPSEPEAPRWWQDVKDSSGLTNVDFFLGSSAWQTDSQTGSLKKDFAKGFLGSAHRWYTRLLLNSAVQELQKSKS
eukprot:jgi/Botrbrau1/16460/Bobra.0142s0055.1